MFYAGFGRRLIAYWVDYTFVRIIYTLLTLVLGIPNYFNVSTLEEVVIAQRPFLFMLFLYFFITDCLPSQGGVGKILLKIKVADRKGNKISFLNSFIRNILKLFQIYLLGIPFIVIIFSSEKQGFHDMLPRCLVVKR